VKGTQDVLPAAERDANLAKFLEPSQVKGRMYHGTSKDFSAFDRLASTKFRRPSMDTVGSWFSSVPEKAERYAGFENRLTMPVHLNIKNPKLYAKFDDFLRDMHEAEGRDFSQQNPKGLGSAEGLREKLKAQGYDGIQFEQTDNESIYNDVMALQEAIKNARKEELGVKRVEREPFTMKRERLEKTLQETNKQFQQLGGSTEFDGHNVFVAFEPTQIKSAIGNRGTYDIEDADINKARGGLAMAGGGSIQENLKNFQNYSVLGQGAPKKPNELSGVVLAGASWLAGDEKTRLAREAFGQDVTNTAIGGQKTSDVLNQLNVFERDGGTFARGTTVVLDIGANDIAQGVDKNIIRKNLNEIVSRLGDSGVNVILSGQPEANSYDEAIKSTNLQMDDLYSDIAAKHPNVTLVDAMSGMLNQKDLMDESGFHLKDEDAKLSYINQFADVYKGANQSETGTPEQVEQVAQTNDFIDIPREIEQITQTSVPETYYAPEVVSAPVVASAPVVVETPQSDGYKWAMQGDGLETYYQNINNYLAEPRTQDEIVAAMEQYRVSQDDIDAARSFAAGHRRGGAINKARGGAINMQKGGKPGKSGALGKIAQAIQSADKEANAAIAAQKAAQVAKPGVDYADPLQPATMRMSEALGNAGAEGKTLHFTEADRSRVFGKNRGGVGFSGLQLYSKPHEEANTVWGFGNKATAEKKIRQNDPENSLFTTFVGSPTQHRSNSVVIGDAIKEFQNSVKKGVVPREQIMLMNKRLNELRDQKTGEKVFENGFDLTDPSALSVANTFSRRAAVGDVMLGLGVKGPMTRLDFKKEFPGTKFVDGSKIENILKRETDPDLVGAGTYDVGNRLFTMDGKIIERPDLNEAFPVQVTGTDLGLKYQLVPPEKAMRDFYKAREGRVDKNKKPSPVSYYDLSRAEPSQFVDENYLTFLQKEGHKTGGSVNKQPIKIKAYGKDIESKIHDEFATHINAAKGGEIKKLAWKAKGGAIKKFPWKAAQGGVPPNPSMETTQPDPTDSGTMRYAGKYAAGGRAQRFDDGGMAAQIPGQSVSAPPADPKSYPRLMAEILGRMAKDQGKEEVGSLRKPRAATDLLNRGMVAPAVGAPVDILNMGLEGIDAVRDLASGKRVDNRLASERPFLGSEHLKDVMSQYGMTTDQERPMMETALSLASPAGALKGASKAAQMAAQAKRPANPLMRRPSNLIKQPG
jgi:lysophospholipase L1-like esterase